MNKFDILVNVSKCTWVTATVLMVLTWFRVWQYSFAYTHYVIEDNFIYIGVLGGWLFISIWYTALIILAGCLIIKLINIIANDAKGRVS